MLRRRLPLVFLLLALSTIAFAAVKEEMVPMRDGVRLATNVMFPEGNGPWPVILTRTPYGKDAGQGDPSRREALYLNNGYVRIVQDCRGRFKSEGKYAAFADDLNDGYDTIEWIAKQSWSNGKVGMTGASAMGITSNLAAMSGAPHLTAAYVTVSHGSGYNYSGYPGGVFLKNLNEEWLRRQGVPPPEIARPIFRSYDDAAKRMDMRTYLDKINVPFYNVGGWYDIFLQGNIDAFTNLQERGGPKARGNQKLSMGPFGHGALSGDLKYPADGGNLQGGPQEALRWFDYWMKGVDNGIMKEPPVRYFVMGDTIDKSAPGNTWRTAASWPPASTTTSYYLAASGKLALAKPAGAEKATYVYDPKDPVPSVGGNNLMMDRGPMDQRKVSGRKDVLKFETEALKSPVEIVGKVMAELAVATDAQDTDFTVKLIDVYPNGYEALVLDQAFRLRYVNGFDKPTKPEPGKVYPIQVDLWSTALIFNTGHKIAIHVSSSNSPRFEPHTNTWEPVKSYDQAIKATNTVFLDGRSRLLLPVMKSESKGSTGAAAR